MQKILTIIIIALTSSCAQMIHDGLSSLNKEKYENQLEYKEGDIIELNKQSASLTNNFLKLDKSTSSKSSYIRTFTVKGKVIILERKIPSQNMTRYGLKGYRTQIVSNIKIPLKWNKIISNIPDSYLPDMKKISFKAKVIKVGRKCEPDHGTISKCVNRSFFEDNLEFISWTPETVKLVNSIIRKNAKRIAENKRQRIIDEKADYEATKHMNPTYQRKTYPLQAKKCDKVFNDISRLKASMRMPAQLLKDREKLLIQNKKSFEKVTACLGSFMFHKEEAEDLSYLGKCIEYYAVGVTGDWCN